MRAATIDPEQLRSLAASRGIDNARELARRAEISEWVLYKALRSGHIRPSHAIALAGALDVSINDLAPKAVIS